ncbi:MAG: glycosyltransferase family 1 protein [Chloroflexota bacterium]|nr:MAG: glycosyltransferase family 1 protein [Chloroflexota bacterium]
MQDEPIRAMQLIGNLDIGGAQEVVRTLAEYLVECGIPTVVVAMRDGPVRGEIERLGIPVEILPGRRHSILSFLGYLKDMLRIRGALRALVKKHRINIIQTHLLRSLDFLVLSLRFPTGKPLVFWTVHNYNFALRADQLPGQLWLLKPKQLTHSFLYRLASRWVNGFIAVSEDVGAAIAETIGPKREKIAVISNGVDVRRYRRDVDRQGIRQELGLPEDARLASVVGTLKEQKGHRYLIEAAAPVLVRRPGLHILIIGDGVLGPALQAQAREAGLEGQIHFLGNRSDVPELLAASDYFILPSLWEGLPMALIEAMASGLPIIATDVSGARQVMDSGETGILVPPGNADELRNAIVQMLANPLKAQAMGAAARRHVEAAYSAQKQVSEHMALYKRELRGLG